MTSSYQSKPEQEKQESGGKQGLVRRYQTPAGKHFQQDQQLPKQQNVVQGPAGPTFQQVPPSTQGKDGGLAHPPPVGVQFSTPAVNSGKPGATALLPPTDHRVESKVENQPPVQTSPEVEGRSIILHRSHNFFVRTTNSQLKERKANPLRKPTGNTTLIPRVMPEQNQRVAESETRMMPKVAPINPVTKATIPFPQWAEAAIVMLGLLVSCAVHAFNMFNFPRYELDEGTYISSAWAILNGMITPYPYGYGHPPLAWMQIAAWVQLTGGFFTFGNALNTGRVLMLVYASGCSLLVYLIVRRLGGSRSTGMLAMIIFSLSPLGITYQRQIFLDNIGTFWLLLSLYFLVMGNSRLLYIVLAAVCFGITLLSKEVFVLFLPCMIYAVWLHTTRFQRKFAIVAFLYTVVAFGSSFVLMAVLKGELFPYSWHLPWDTHNHLSMMQTFLDQGKRGQNEGSFGQSWQNWVNGDSFLMICSVVALVFNIVVGWWNRRQLLIGLMGLSFWLLLIRGGVVLSFYLIPLIPLVAINTAMAVNTIMNWIGKFTKFDIVRAGLVIAVIAIIVPYDLSHIGGVFTQHPTTAQTATMNWIREHVPHNSFIVINSYLYMDLREPGGQGVGDGATYPYAHVYFNVATDPELHDKILQGNWDRIDYIVADSEMLNDIKNFGGPMSMLKTALDNSVLRTEFRADDHESQLVIKIYEVKHKFLPPMVHTPAQQNSSGVAIGTIAVNRRWLIE